MTGGESLPSDQEAQQLPELGAASSKTRPQTLRDFERALRDIGYSRSEATAIAKGGFKAVQADSVSEQLEDLAAEIRRYAGNFKLKESP